MLVLHRAVEGARWKLCDVDYVAINVPIDLPGARQIDANGFGPAIEAPRNELICVAGIARRQRLKMMQGTKITNRPGNERRQPKNRDKARSDNGGGQRSAESPSLRLRQRCSVARLRIRASL